MNGKPTVAIFSDSNFFCIHLVESLLSKSCDVIVFAPDRKDWLVKTTHIPNSTNLQIVDEKKIQLTFIPNYCIFCLGFLNDGDVYRKFKSLYSNQTVKGIKSLAIFPAEVFDAVKNDSLPLNSNLSIIYLNDLMGPRIDFEGVSRISKVLLEVFETRSMTVGVGEVFYPTFTPNVAKLISKWIFSFGPYGKEVFVLGTEISAPSLWRQLIKVVPETKLFYDKNIEIPLIPRGILRETLNSNLAFLLSETLVGMSKRLSPSQKSQKIIKQHQKTIRSIIIFFISLFLLPIVCVFVSAMLLFAAYKSYVGGGVELARNLTLVSKIPSRIGKVFAFYSSDLSYSLYLTNNLADVGLAGLDAAESASELVGKILGNEIYDPDNVTGKLRASLNFLYQSVSIIQVETVSNMGGGGVVAKKVSKKIDFEKYKTLLTETSKVLQELPEILGKDQRKTYLVLFQNNMEIRPAGGFIGSFAVVTFEGGRMTDFSVSDVYSADGQLKGHIEPPAPIRKYLGEANWFLRDSNWDPDFPTSAKRAEWFIDKEIGRSVDGVAAIDLSPVKDALLSMGPMYLADYDMDITSENLYEKTQEEVHEDFFPGTQKKASFLTALSRNMVSTLSDLDSAQKLELMKSFYRNLEARHVQFYFHNEKAQIAIANLGWAGEIAKGNCGENCYPDFLGLVEANLGVNKANYFISRDQNLEVNISEGRVERKLTINFKNSANPALGAPANYKSYVRVLVPFDASVQGTFDVTESRGLKEIGFLIEVAPGQSKEIDLSWTSAGAEENYGVFVRKQAGTDEGGNLFVAIDGKLVYNSKLTRDLWMQKP